LIEAVITAAVEAEEIVPVPVGPLAHVLMGALDEAALVVVRTPSSSDEVAATLELLLGGLRLGADARAGSPARKRSRPARRRG
jgi:hypothetical protein